MEWYWCVNYLDDKETHHNAGTFRGYHPSQAIELAKKFTRDIEGKYYAFRNEPERIAAIERLKPCPSLALPRGTIFGWRSEEDRTQYYSVLQALEPITVTENTPLKSVLVIASSSAESGETLSINPKPNEIKAIPDPWYYGNCLPEFQKEFLARVVHETTIRLSPEEDLGAWEKLDADYKTMLKIAADTVIKFDRELFL